MRKVINFLKMRWHAATPLISRFLQFLSLVVTFAPTYYDSLPQDFKQSIPTNWLLGFSAGGFFVALVLQFTAKKEKK